MSNVLIWLFLRLKISSKKERLIKMKKTFFIVMIFLAVYPSISAAKINIKKKEQNVLRIGTPQEVKSPNVFGDYNMSIFINISNPPLMKIDPQGHITGLTASKVHMSQDFTEWTFIIRDDLYWSDGTKFSADDVLFSIVYTGKHYPYAAWIKNTVESAELVDENTVRIKFSRPYTRLDLEFTSYNIFPKHIYEDIYDPMNHLNSGENIGFGPFFIQDIDLNAGVIRFSRNPYWQGRQPHINGFEIHMYKNTDILSLALEKGDVDTYYKYASSYPYANIERLKKTDAFDFFTKLNIGLVFMAFNLKQGATTDLDFRKALSYAVDYNEILQLDALGFGKIPTRGFVPPSMAGYTESEDLEYDPDRARLILSDAGYADRDKDGFLEDRKGQEISLSLLVRDDWARIGELLENYFAQIGIKTAVRFLDLNSWVAAKDHYDYDVLVARSTPWGMFMHANWGTGYFDSRRTGQGVLHNVDDPSFLKLCDEILASGDPQKLKGLARSVQMYYAEKIPAVALYWNEIVTPLKKEFSGWKHSPLYGIYNIDSFISVRKTE